MASEAGLSALALTDHDCLDGLAAFREAASGFEAIDGVEVSARRDQKDIHILGLFIDPDDAVLRQRLAALAETRANRVDAMISRLQAAGVAITAEDVWKQSKHGTLGRPHIALALMEIGAARTMDEAFRRYLRPRTPGFVPKAGPTPEEAIAWIHEAGGVAVLAHPGLMRNPGWIEGLAEAGLDGLEVWHPKHDQARAQHFLTLADSLDLVPSGGSDYHGPSVGDSRVGQEPVPFETVERLRERRPRI
jgi:predicted metal-dependent phosphoesterase TrpH